MNWAILQNGIGIDIQAGSLIAICVKRQWKRVRVTGRLEIPNYRTAGPEQCGKLYREFLRRNGLKAPWTVVALPRSHVLLRWLNFPQAVEKDLASAVAYQLDSLHPFEEGTVYWDFAAWKNSSGAADGAGRIEVPVAIAEKKFVDETAAWFRDAGIGVSQFTVSTAALCAGLAVRLLARADADPRHTPSFFVLNAGLQTLQFIGYSPGSLVSKEVPLPSGGWENGEAIRALVEHELALTRSELRLADDDRPPLILCGKSLPFDLGDASRPFLFAVSSADDLFSLPGAGAENFRLQENATAFMAALEAADRSLPIALNLLPAEARTFQSPLVYFPAFALSGLIVVLLILLGLRGTVQDWRYEQYIDRQIQSLQPQVTLVEAAQEHSRKMYERLNLLADTGNSPTVPLEILNELTRLFPDDAWLQELQYDGNTLSFSGFAKSASPLLQTLANSPYFESPQFLSAISKRPDGKEGFRIGVRLRKSP
jgi:Tfp pilus assembly protein PilN